MTYGIEARGDGFSKSAFFKTANELLVSVTSLQSKPEQVVVGTNTGFIRKVWLAEIKTIAPIHMHVMKL